jgi:hypothetical protein
MGSLLFYNSLERRYRNLVSTHGLAKSRAWADKKTGFLGILNRCSRVYEQEKTRSSMSFRGLLFT